MTTVPRWFPEQGLLTAFFCADRCDKASCSAVHSAPPCLFPMGRAKRRFGPSGSSPFGPDPLRVKSSYHGVVSRRAFTVQPGTDPRAPYVFTCEHASNNLVWHQASRDDRVLVDDHWGYDIGAADVTRDLSRAFGAAYVRGEFSRLIIDANRAPDDATLIVTEIDGHCLSFNAHITDDERKRRGALYQSYHAGVDDTITHRMRASTTPFTLVSVHSFTPVYLGQHRAMEIGVLFDEYEQEAWQLQQTLQDEGFVASLNEPYTGKSVGGQRGLIYSVATHARRHGLLFLELEIRQDLLRTAAQAKAVSTRIERALRVVASMHKP
jgi:predicted N-formylglutamate amidohydrolase